MTEMVQVFPQAFTGNMLTVTLICCLAVSALAFACNKKYKKIRQAAAVTASAAALALAAQAVTAALRAAAKV